MKFLTNIVKLKNMNKDLVTLILKIVVAIATAILGAIGVSVVSSCTAYRSADSYGRTTITVVDTTYIDHKGTYNISVK